MHPDFQRTNCPSCGCEADRNEWRYVAGLDVRIVTFDGKLLRQITLDTTKTNQPCGHPRYRCVSIPMSRDDPRHHISVGGGVGGRTDTKPDWRVIPWSDTYPADGGPHSCQCPSKPKDLWLRRDNMRKDA